MGYHVAILVGLDLIVNALPYLMPNIVFHKLASVILRLTLYVRRLNYFILGLKVLSFGHLKVLYLFR